MGRYISLLGLPVFLLAGCSTGIADDSGAARETLPAQHVIYLHGRIIEDQGIDAVSPEYGPYRFTDIADRFRDEGFETYAPVRGPGADPQTHAQEIAERVRQMMAEGVPAQSITVVGASKGAYIASLVSNLLDEVDLHYVILAGCSRPLVEGMLASGTRFSGHVLAIRDASDTQLSGSCSDAIEASPDVATFREIVVETGLSHGLIYTPNDAWVLPVLDWMR